MPDVVVLNGGSSAGKSMLARALQEILPGLWLVFGTDEGMHYDLEVDTAVMTPQGCARVIAHHVVAGGGWLPPAGPRPGSAAVRGEPRPGSGR